LRMALQHTRLISKVFKNRVIISAPTLSQFKRHNSDSSGGAPYRPYPATKYQWSESAKYWSDEGHKPQSAEDDEYPVEEVYLSEIEARLARYDSKFHDSDKVKEMYNEFGWEAIDDRATFNYGGSLGGDQYGPGKKIDPSHYVTPEWTNVNRKAIPPIQYMTADQLRRSRGSLASVRELPAETQSIWKYWNFYSCLGGFSIIMLSKEFFVTGGHEMMEAIMMWSIFGTVASVASDWYAWWHTLLMQEAYDRKYFPLLQAVRKYNAMLENVNEKPNEKKLMAQMQQYRELVAEKVLEKTLANRLGRITESTFAKMEAKMSEEAQTKKAAEDAWKRSAMAQTVGYFEDGQVRKDFMAEALSQFCAGDTAKIGKSAGTAAMSSGIFGEQYKANFEGAKTTYLSEQRAKGSLSPVFMDEAERRAQFQSSADKTTEYERRVNEWADSHNAVNAPTPSFS